MQHFVAITQQHTGQQNVPGLDQVEMPQAIKDRFYSSYKDSIAIQGQRWIERALSEYHIQDKFKDMFKDWLITGRSCSYKGIRHGTFYYERVSPINLDYDKSPDTVYIEDGEW